jgi:hypothetical protein
LIPSACEDLASIAPVDLEDFVIFIHLTKIREDLQSGSIGEVAHKISWDYVIFSRDCYRIGCRDISTCEIQLYLLCLNTDVVTLVRRTAESKGVVVIEDISGHLRSEYVIPRPTVIERSRVFIPKQLKGVRVV